jgi:streptomycin 6-kinase
MDLVVPERLVAACAGQPERTAWLARLPGALLALAGRWSLALGPPFEGDDVSASWVAPATRADGTGAVLKLGIPHMEAEHELAGLRLWAGDPTVRLLEADEDLGAMLLERCQPGTPLRSLPEPEQDVVLAGLLRRLWRVQVPPGAPFRPLAEMTAYWAAESLAAAARWPDPGLVREGLTLLAELPGGAPAATHVLLATDLHAGNVLRAEREPWLVIDPKPFVGDPAYDATQHLFNCTERVVADPAGTIARFADLLGVERQRVRAWMFARAAAEARQDWDDEWFGLAPALAPL